MVTDGPAVTVAPVVALNPVVGDQVYVVAPLAVNCVDVPAQRLTVEGEMDTDSEDDTDTTAVAVAVQPEAFVPVTVYVVVAVGEAVTVVPDVLLRPEAGLHVAVVAPETTRDVLPPVQIDVLEGVTLTAAGGLTTNDTVDVFLHVLEPVPVTV